MSVAGPALDVIGTHARASDNFELLGLGDDLGSYSRTAANHQSVVVANNRGQFNWLLRRHNDDFKIGRRLENLNALFT